MQKMVLDTYNEREDKMKDFGYKDLNLRTHLSDVGSALRYLRGKDQVAIKLDDPDFFSIAADDIDNVSTLSSARRLLRKKTRKQKKEVH